MLEEFYKQGVDLISPYLRFIDTEPADSSTPAGRADIQEGIEKLKAVVGLAPGLWHAFWAIGKAYEALDQPNEQYSYFRRAFELHPGDPDVAREYMRVCLALGKGEEGVLAARQACHDCPGDSGLLSNLGLALLVAGDVEEAMAVTLRSLELSPDSEIAQSLLQGIRDIKDGKAERPARWP